MHFDWWTFGLQAFNFLILVWILQHFLYKPVRRFMAERQAEAEAALNEAAAANLRADELKKEFEQKAEALIAERDKLIRDARVQIAGERDEAIDKAHDEARRTIEAERRQIRKERGEALSELEEEALDLALDLAAKIMKGAATKDVADVFLARVDHHLTHLPKAELASLRSQLDDTRATLKVRTWPALDQEAKDIWTERLHDHLGTDKRITFSKDEHLIAGAELRFPNAVLHFSWKDALDLAKKELSPNAGQQ